MASDAHAHPFDLAGRFSAALPSPASAGELPVREISSDMETERRNLGIPCAASAWNGEQFAYHRELARSAREAGAAPMALCFALHPQLPAAVIAGDIPGLPGEAAAAEGRLPPGNKTGHAGTPFMPLLDVLGTLAAEGVLNAVGETGFDLFDARFRASEAVQDELFAAHLEIALRYALPLVLHVRRAMHKVFAQTGALKKLPAVVFHSWSGTAGEGAALLRRGVKAYFSFGASIIKNHKEAVRSCAALPLDHLLLETDAPYQPLRDREFSRWADLRVILNGAAQIRREAGASGGDSAELEAATDRNFNEVFFPSLL